MKNTIVIALTILTMIATLPVEARGTSGHSHRRSDTGMWIAAGACSLVYTPIKLGMFGFFGITGALSYVGTLPANRTDISEKWMSVGYNGDWIIRPEHLRGTRAPHLVSLKASTAPAPANHMKAKPIKAKRAKKHFWAS